MFMMAGLRALVGAGIQRQVELKYGLKSCWRVSVSSMKALCSDMVRDSHNFKAHLVRSKQGPKARATL